MTLAVTGAFFFFWSISAALSSARMLAGSFSPFGSQRRIIHDDDERSWRNQQQYDSTAKG
jgi:hypothetical protein